MRKSKPKTAEVEQLFLVPHKDPSAHLIYDTPLTWKRPKSLIIFQNVYPVRQSQYPLLFVSILYSFFFFFFFLVLLGPNLWHLEVPRLGTDSELQLPAYTTATATWDLSQVCNLHHNSLPCQIFDPLSKARVRTCVLIDTSWVRWLLSHGENSLLFLYFYSNVICGTALLIGWINESFTIPKSSLLN